MTVKELGYSVRRLENKTSADGESTSWRRVGNGCFIRGRIASFVDVVFEFPFRCFSKLKLIHPHPNLAVQYLFWGTLFLQQNALRFEYH